MCGRLSDKIGRTKTCMIGAAGELGFLIILPNLFERLVVIPQGTPLIESYQMVGPIIIVGGFLFFLGSAFIQSILEYIGAKASRDIRVYAMGLYCLRLSVKITTRTT